MGLLDDRVAMVTGGTDGIGKAIAAAFLAEGATVLITGRTERKAATALAELGAGDRAAFVAADAMVQAQAEAAVDHCVEHFGRVDILVNNVGGASSQFAVVHELTDKGWEDGLVRNLYSSFWTTRRALPSMLANGWGRIINISSVLGKLCTMPAIAPYVVPKHALAGLTKSVAHEYGQQGITCNAICPGGVATETMVANAAKVSAASGGTADEVLSGFAEGSVTKRLATPEEVAAVAVLMASEAGASITGVQWSVDGGTAPF